MSPDYFAPAFKVDVNGIGLAVDILKHIQQVSVTSERNSMDHFRLSIANPYPDLRWTDIEKDAQLFAVDNAVTIKMGYVGEEQLMIAGEITQVTAQFPESGTPTLAIEGHSRLHRLDRRPRTQPFKNSTDKQIAEQIAREHGLTPQVQETEATRIVHPSVVQYNQTDFNFLLTRARHIDFELRVEDRTLIFRRAHSTDTPITVLEWGKSLRNFSPTLQAKEQVSRVTVRGYDPRTKQEIVGQFISPGSGGQTGPEVAERVAGRRDREEECVDIPIQSQQEADQLAQAIYNACTRRLLTGSGTTIGLPGLRAGQVIGLQGLGMFNGKYRLTTVTHTFDTGGYTTSFVGEWFP